MFVMPPLISTTGAVIDAEATEVRSRVVEDFSDIPRVEVTENSPREVTSVLSKEDSLNADPDVILTSPPVVVRRSKSPPISEILSIA
jgi:hypothetical protein